MLKSGILINKVRYNTLVGSMHQGLMEISSDEDTETIAADIASTLLSEEVFIKPFLEIMGETDIEGRLAKDILEGNNY